MQLKDFESLIQPLLEGGKKCVSYRSDKLLNPGENFGSTMVAINVLLRDQSGKEETVRCVAKLLPPKVMWTAINPQATFKYEMSIYTKLVPILNDFIKKIEGEELTCFARCFGARMSLNANIEQIGEDTIILLENLTSQGYVMCNKLIGFDKATAEVLLKDLSKLHAVPIAFKYFNPAEFQDKLLPLIKRAHVLLFRKETMTTVWNRVEKELLKYPHSFVVIEKLRKVFNEVEIRKHERYHGEIREPFATLIHYDFWTNNMMVKFENSHPVASKILDFQMCDYNICASDVLFFIYSSIRLEDLKGNLDYFLHFYYDQLMLCLSKAGCSSDKFTYDLFYKDVEYASRFDLLHVLVKGSAIFATKEDAQDLAKISEDNNLFPTKTHENFGFRLRQILSDFVERGWL